MSFYYVVIGADGIPTSTGVAHDVNGKPINTLEEYNKSVLGPMQVPSGGRVISFSGPGEQKAWLDKLSAARNSGNASVVARLMSKQPSQSASTFPVIPVAIGAAVVLLFFLSKRK